MIDFPQITPYKCDIQQYFYKAVAPAYVWNKPRGISFVYIWMLGAGGGGGGGFSGASGTQRGGGGGGACGAIYSHLFTDLLVPDQLRIRPGSGGAGSSGSGVAGSNGSASGVLGINSNSFFFSAAPGNGGSAGTAAAGGNGGFPSTGVSWDYSLSLSIAGSVGGSGSANNIGAPDYFLEVSTRHGGTGGGGVSTLNVGGAGGNYTVNSPIANYPVPLGGAANSNGANGYTKFSPVFQSVGGTGGGGSGAGTGGKGGNGGLGAGGGGGGGGITGGAGGNGGDGFIMIVSW